MFDEMPNSHSPNFSGVRKRKWGEYVAEKWDPITKKLVWSGTFNTAEEASEAYLVKQREFASAHHLFDEMPSSNSTNKIAAAAAERSKGYTFNTAEEASEAYLMKQCEFASAHHMYDEMPSSNLTNKAAATAAVAAPSPSERTKADNGKTLFIKEISFRDKSPLLGAEWHNMGRLKKNDPFKKRKVCKAFDSNMHESKNPVKVMNQGKEPVTHVESDRCNTVKRGRKAKTGLLGIRSLKNGKYGAEIRDPIKNKTVWLGTFDTIEEASQAYLSKKCEFDVLSQGNKENEPKNCDQTQPESSVGASLSSLCRNKQMNSSKTTRIVGVHKNKWGKYTSEIIDPISKKKIWLGTFSTYEEAFTAYRTKKLEFQGLVKPKKCNKKMHSTSREKEVGKEKLVNVQQGYLNGQRFQPKSAAEEMLHANQHTKLPVQGSKEDELQSKMPVDFSTLEKQGYVNGERFQPKSAAEEMLHANQYMKLPVQGSKEAELQSKMPVDFSTLEKQGYVNGERFQPKSAAEELLHANQYMKLPIQGSKEAELQSKMPVDFSTVERQGGQEDADMCMGQWVQLPDGREVKISLELGLPIIDNYGSLLGEFSSLDDLRIYDENIF